MSLADNLEKLEVRIQEAARKAGRSREEISLIAVSKKQPPQVVREAAGLGLRTFGENRVQEAKAKISMCPGSLSWHLIGHLQSNKARDAILLFEMIHSVDSLELAQELQNQAEKLKRRIRILLEVNVSGEASKFGLKPHVVKPALEHIMNMSRLEVEGFMTMAPFYTEPEKTVPHFADLRELRDQCRSETGLDLPHLSMGMTNDFPYAIAEGATMIRIGTALFSDSVANEPPGISEASVKE